MTKMIQIKWLDAPEEHDFDAAVSYLSLVYNEKDSKSLALKLKNVQMSHFKAKDIFRASEHSLLGISNFHVKKNIKKINEGIGISPILLVRDSINGKVIIADGYHRLCAIYTFNEDIVIPCKIVG